MSCPLDEEEGVQSYPPSRSVLNFMLYLTPHLDANIGRTACNSTTLGLFWPAMFLRFPCEIQSNTRLGIWSASLWRVWPNEVQPCSQFSYLSNENILSWQASRQNDILVPAEWLLIFICESPIARRLIRCLITFSGKRDTEILHNKRRTGTVSR